MTVRISVARARQLGLPGVEAAATTPRRAKRARATVPAAECAPNICVACGVELARPVDEDRHATAHPTHRRYESTLTRRPVKGRPIWWCARCERYSHCLESHTCGKRQG